MIDGRIVFRKPIGGQEDLALADREAGTGRARIMERFSKIPVQVAAGVRDVVMAFIDRPQVESDENVEGPAVYNGLTGSQAPPDRMPHLRDGVEITGPLNPKGVSRTPSRADRFSKRIKSFSPGISLAPRGQKMLEKAPHLAPDSGPSRTEFRTEF